MFFAVLIILLNQRAVFSDSAPEGQLYDGTAPLFDGTAPLVDTEEA